MPPPKSKPVPKPSEISDADLLIAYQEREKEERAALRRVNSCASKVEGLKEQLKTAKEDLEQAQIELAVAVGRDVQTTLYSSTPATAATDASGDE
jgi:hypothetical protein